MAIREEVRNGKKTGYYIYDYRDSMGKRHQKRARTKALAQALLRRAQNSIEQEILSGRPAMSRISFKEFGGEYIRRYAKVNKSSWQRDEISIEHLSKFFSGKLLGEITPRDIEDYKAHRQAFVKKSTINRELACLKCMFNQGIKWGYVKENPVRSVSLFKENNQRIRFLEPQERDRLLAYSPPYLKPIIITALNTGLRRSELLRLTWSDIDFDRRLIRVSQSKSGEPRYIPMNNLLTETLQNVTKRLDSPYIFRNSKGNPYKSVRSAFEKAVKQAGLKDFSFHCLRHDFASHLAMAGVDIKTIMELMGHKTIAMTLRYSHLSPAHKQSAVDKLEAFVSKEKEYFKGQNATYMQHRKQAQAVV